MEIIVIGGGITGQMVQWAVPEARILDWKDKPTTPKSLTREYGANYLWVPFGNVPYRSFDVVTTIDGEEAKVDAIQRYKKKIGRFDESEAIRTITPQFQMRTQGHEFESLPEARISYNHRIVAIDLSRQMLTVEIKPGLRQEHIHYDYLVSTVPLYSLLSMCGLRQDKPLLNFKSIYVRVDTRPPDAPFPVETVYVNYLTDPAVTPYRFTDRNGERHWEALSQIDGAHNFKIVPGKIYPNPHVPKYLGMLSRFNIVCFGRFGTWASDELIHETWNHIDLWKRTVYEPAQ